MFEGLASGILNKLFKGYFRNLDAESLKIGVFSGNVELRDLELDPDALALLELPVKVRIYRLSRGLVYLRIP